MDILGLIRIFTHTTNFREYAEKILEIETGVDTTDATAIASDIINNKTDYVNDEKIAKVNLIAEYSINFPFIYSVFCILTHFFKQF